MGMSVNGAENLRLNWWYWRPIAWVTLDMAGDLIEDRYDFEGHPCWEAVHQNGGHEWPPDLCYDVAKRLRKCQINDQLDFWEETFNLARRHDEELANYHYDPELMDDWIGLLEVSYEIGVMFM